MKEEEECKLTTTDWKYAAMVNFQIEKSFSQLQRLCISARNQCKPRLGPGRFYILKLPGSSLCGAAGGRSQ